MGEMKPHWPEYLMEALALGLFMVSACSFGVLLEYPQSPVHQAIAPDLARRALMGLAMGATAIALILSPFGKRSGAHMNPSVTLTFLRLGKIAPVDAAGYIAAQFAGGVVGVMAASGAIAAVADPHINYVATVPGPWGRWVALAAEILLSFLMMTMVLNSTNHRRLARYTPYFAGALVAMFITMEAPLSGMSMNPARTFGSAVAARLWDTLWIYFLAPPVGMLLAAELYLRTGGIHRVFCAKLHHHNDAPCIFRCRFPQLAGCVVLAFALAGPLAAQRVAAVDSVAMTVSDASRSAEFFTQILDFEKVSDVEVAGEEYERLQGLFGLRLRVVRLRLGGEFVELHQYLAPEGRPLPAAFRSNDRWFQHVAIIVSDMDRAYRRLREHNVRHASTGPQRLPDWNPNAGGIQAFYFRDPDGHHLEILQFPPGKGAVKWQDKSRLFLGVDHTAIVVGSTEQSLGFYRDRLGMRVAGASENYGTEQEHLNNIFGARLRITALRAADGPGIELLEYLAPTDGRPIPADLHPNDLAWWQTRLMVMDKGELPRTATSLSDGRLGFEAGTIVSDPDGHRMQVAYRANREGI